MEITLLDANTWLAPPTIAFEQTKRIKALINLIKKLDPDIITLQEVWMSHYVTRLRKEFKNYQVITSGKGIYNKSGLVTLTKLKPTRINFNQFDLTKNHNFVEKAAKKGYLTIKLRFNKKLFSIINTHLYAAETDKKQELEITKNQFNVLKKFTKKGNIILAGDLNLTKTDFLKLNKNHFQNKPVKEITFSTKNKYRRSDKDRRNTILDYVLIRTNPKLKISITQKVLTNSTISDHYPILAKIKIQ